MSSTHTKRNKEIVLEAFEMLFNKRDSAAAERFWSPDYLQHSAHIAPGREGLFELTKGLPNTLHYENAIAIAEGEFVILHGCFSGHGLKRSWIVADIVRLQGGVLVEHWDVIQDEATESESKSGRPMFGSSFAPADASRRQIADQPEVGRNA
jgi:predicted SnoaL-like aldol condensation-catalyzing enzyme